MSRIAQDVERLVPRANEWPLIRGVLVGIVIGAAAAGLVILGQTLAERRLTRQQGPTPPPPAAPGQDGATGSPL